MRRNNLEKNLKQQASDKEAAQTEKLNKEADKKALEQKITILAAAALLGLELKKKPRRRTVGEFLTDWI